MLPGKLILTFKQCLTIFFFHPDKMLYLPDYLSNSKLFVFFFFLMMKFFLSLYRKPDFFLIFKKSKFFKIWRSGLALKKPESLLPEVLVVGLLVKES